MTGRLKNAFLNMKLLHKIILCNIVCIILPITFLSIFFSFKTSSSLKDQYLKEISFQFDTELMQINEKIDAITTMAKDISYNYFVLRFLDSSFATDAESVFHYNDIEKLISSVYSANKGSIKDIRIYYANVTIPEKWPLFIRESRLEDFRPQSYKDGKDQMPIWLLRYKMLNNGELEPDTESLIYFYPIINSLTLEKVGTVAIEVNLQYIFSSFITVSSDIKNGFIDDQNQVIIGNLPSNALPSGFSGEGRIPVKQGVCFVTKIPNLNGRMVKYVSDKPYSEQIKNNNITIIIVAFCCCLVFILLLSMIISFLLTALDEVVYTMNMVGKGDFDRRITVKSNDEVGQLSASFNQMTENIQRLNRKIREQERSLKNAEIHALQSQMRPHFIYNTLDQFKSRLEMKGEFEVSDAISSMAKMLRYTNNWSFKSTVNEELLQVRNFIKIKTLASIDVNCFATCPKELERCSCMRLSVQPIVENCIKHGTNGKKGINIEISVKKESEHLLIEVFDDGCGLQPEKLSVLNSLLKESKGQKLDDRDTVGLQNIHDRIRFYYGEAYGLSIESEYGIYTKVTMRLPFEAAGVESCISF